MDSRRGGGQSGWAALEARSRSDGTAEGATLLGDGAVETVVEIVEGIARPESTTQLVAREQLDHLLAQRSKNLEAQLAWKNQNTVFEPVA